MDGKEKAKKVWGSTPAGFVYGEGHELGTKEYFESVLAKRFGYEMPWLLELAPFEASRDRSVLEIGCGAGYDAWQFCRNGANYTGIDLVPLNIERTTRHLAHYGFHPRIQEGDGENLAFPSGSFDIVFSNGVLHHTPDIRKSFKEVSRVLRAEGEFWVILYHKNSVFHWISLFLFDHVLKFGFLRRTFRERLSMIEYNTSGERPIVNVYTRGELRALLEEAGLTVEWIKCRKLLREDLPLSRRLRPLFNVIPQSWLDRVGYAFGWYLVAKARQAAASLSPTTRP
jgi:SAM-dependent methyltransferase